MKPKISIGLFLGLLLPLLAVIAGGARYIVEMQWKVARLNTEIGRLERQAAATSNSAAPAPVVPSGPRSISAEQRATMLAELATETGPKREVWFSRDDRDTEARAYQRALQGVFEEAGWTVRSSTAAEFALLPGIFFLMADDEPPTYALTARNALQNAGLKLTSGRGYRVFNERKKQEDPSWRGFDMGEDQTYIVAVGRKPKQE